MYGNIAKAHSKDKKTRYYYYCKNTVTPTGHECSFRLNIEQAEINKFVAKVISAMVNNPRFVEAIQAKIGTAVDTEDMEKQIAVLQGQLKQAFGTKNRLERQMDHAEQLRALRQKRRKRGDNGAADAAALSVQNDDGHNCLRIVKSFVNSGNRFRQNRPRPAGKAHTAAAFGETWGNLGYARIWGQ